MMARATVSLVAESNFMLATRDTGYRSTGAAVAELLDNSLEAGASTIHVLVFIDETSPDHPMTLAVLDNGCGMDPETLRVALRFGGSTRFNSRAGLGRFGMGLPNSSLSQCRRVELYSWQQGTSPHVTYLDVDEICREKMRVIPVPRRRQLPPWARDKAAASGTLVAWSHCDRLDHRRITTIIQKLHGELGRKFRYWLFNGKQILINGILVQPIDPLYCHPAAVLSGAQEYHMPLEYSLISRLASDVPPANVRVRFAKLPVRLWHSWTVEQKRRYNISGGAGVSVVRAGREIAYGWFFLHGKRKQNYDDWWRCEVTFDAALDEWFGVTHSKQGINPTSELNEILGRDMAAIANTLNAQVCQEFATIKAESDRPAIHAAMRNDWRLPPVASTSPSSSVVEVWAPQGLPQEPNVQYRLRVSPLASREFFTWRLDGNTLWLEINQDHPFFERVYRPAADARSSAWLHQLECLLLALARTEAQRPERDRQLLAEVREAWSNALLAFLI
jgi:hypothetical protein